MGSAYSGWKAWPREVMEQLEQRWPLGTSARTCYGRALWLGNRRGDVARLRWDQRGIVALLQTCRRVSTKCFSCRTCWAGSTGFDPHALIDCDQDSISRNWRGRSSL